MNWKTLAIIFMILFYLETCFFVYSAVAYNSEVKKMNICYYEICGDFPDAYYENNICHCYDYDLMGELNVVQSKVMR